MWVLVVMTGTLHIRAEGTELNVDYTTELQTNFRNRANWVNLLHLDLSCRLKHGLGFRVSTISISETTENRVMEDLLTFSNIEEESIPLALSVIGVEWNKGASSVFLGVRNMNEDYFNSPSTSLFTNSSCGIFPTLSVNYPLANYPCSSLGIVYSIALENVEIVTSLYNGRGYRYFAGKENVFRFCPSSDGILGVSTLKFNRNGSSYYMGVSLYSGISSADVQGTEGYIGQKEEKRLSCVLWGYAEQKLTDRVSLLLQASRAMYSDAECTAYYGIGTVVECRKDIRLGVFAGHACFSSDNETVAELTCNIPVSSRIYIQPALHYVDNRHFSGAAGLLRMGWSL